MVLARTGRGVLSARGLRWRRRAVLAGTAAAVLAWVRYAPELGRLFGPGLSFSAFPDLPPFRALDQGGAGAPPSVLFAGLDATAQDSGWQSRLAEVRADPCAFLFGDAAGAEGGGPGLPVALFSDYNCPDCRQFEATLAAYIAAHPGTIRVIRHELPLLGPASVVASRAVLAAGLQGGYAAMNQRLLRAPPVADPRAMAAMAGAIGLDPGRLLRDMSGPQVQRRLDRDRALAALFGFFATPGAVAGRTSFLGAIPAATFGVLVSDELALPPVNCRAA